MIVFLIFSEYIHRTIIHDIHTLDEEKRSDRGRGMHNSANVALLSHQVRKGLSKPIYSAALSACWVDSSSTLTSGISLTLSLPATTKLRHLPNYAYLGPCRSVFLHPKYACHVLVLRMYSENIKEKNHHLLTS